MGLKKEDFRKGSTRYKSLLILLVAAIRIVPAQEDHPQELIFPIIASGVSTDEQQGPHADPHFETTLVFDNRTAASTSVNLQIFRTNGEEIHVRPPSFPFFPFTVTGPTELPPNSIKSLSLFQALLIPPVIPPRIIGWGRLILPRSVNVEAEAEVVFFRSPPAPTTSVHFRAVQPRNRFRISLVDRPNREVGIVIVNPSAGASATVSLSFETEAGFRKFSGCPTSLLVQPRHSVLKLLEELCGQQDRSVRSFPSPSGVLIVTSDLPIAVAGVHLHPNGTFSALVARPD